MTEATDWLLEAKAVRAQLAKIERAAVDGGVPAEAIAEVKSAVDHCRTTLWSASIAAGDAESVRTAALLAARLARVQEMCDRIVDEVAAGRVWVGTPGLGRFVATLDVTERCVRALLDDSAASAES